MRATRATGLWSGLILIVVMAGSDSPATGRPGGGAPLAPLFYFIYVEEKITGQLFPWFENQNLIFSLPFFCAFF